MHRDVQFKKIKLFNSSVQILTRLFAEKKLLGTREIIHIGWAWNEFSATNDFDISEYFTVVWCLLSDVEIESRGYFNTILGIAA